MAPRQIAANEVRTGDLIKVSFRGMLRSFDVLSRKLTCGGSQVDLELAEKGSSSDVHKILSATSQVTLINR